MDKIQEIWAIEEKIDIADWEGWKLYVVCDTKKTADEILDVYNNQNFRKRKVKVAVGVTKGGNMIYLDKSK